jgi:Bacterial surface proteins containing Ig-like domains
MTVDITTHNTTIALGKKLQLEVVTDPPGVQLIWTSSDSVGAPVSATGLVIGNIVGSYQITATTLDMMDSDTVTVIVVDLNPTYHLKISPNKWEGVIGETKSLITEILPEGNPVTYTSSDSTIVSVSDSGQMAAVGKGNALVQARSGNLVDVCSCKILPAVITDIVLNVEKVVMGVNRTFSLEAQTVPEGGEISFSTSGTVITVTERGLIASNSIGNGIVEVSSGNITKYVNVAVCGVNLPKSINLDSELIIPIISNPSDAVITWKSTNENVFVVDDLGNGEIKLTRTGVGRALLIASIEVSGETFVSDCTVLTSDDFDWILELTPEVVKGMKIYNTELELYREEAVHEMKIGLETQLVPKLYYIRKDWIPNTFNYRLVAVQEDIDKWQLNRLS